MAIRDPRRRAGGNLAARTATASAFADARWSGRLANAVGHAETVVYDAASACRRPSRTPKTRRHPAEWNSRGPYVRWQAHGTRFDAVCWRTYASKQERSSCV